MVRISDPCGFRRGFLLPKRQQHPRRHAAMDLPFIETALSLRLDCASSRKPEDSVPSRPDWEVSGPNGATHVETFYGD